MTAGRVNTEGADLHFDVEGSGPPLLMIPGRGGTGGRYARIGAILQDRYTTIRYDRRCCGRSSGDAARPMQLTQQARDTLAILGALGLEQAYYFGNSAGAAIALRVLEVYPERVLGMVAHEPMVPAILPDRDDWFGFNREVSGIYTEQGPEAALRLLATSMVGMDGPPPSPGKPGAPPPKDDMDVFFGTEFMALCYYHPDLERLRDSADKLIATKGAASKEAYYARTADVVGQRVGCPVRTMSGNHIAHAAAPDIFAKELGDLLTRFGAGSL